MPIEQSWSRQPAGIPKGPGSPSSDSAICDRCGSYADEVSEHRCDRVTSSIGRTSRTRYQNGCPPRVFVAQWYVAITEPEMAERVGMCAWQSRHANNDNRYLNGRIDFGRTSISPPS